MADDNHIIQDVDLYVKGYKTKTSPNVKCYFKDSFYLLVDIYPYMNAQYCMFLPSYSSSNGAEPLKLKEGSEVQLFFESPRGDDYRDYGIIENGQVKIYIDKLYTSVEGFWTIQMIILDNNDCRRTIPPFTYEVKYTTDDNWNEGKAEIKVLLYDDDITYIALEDSVDNKDAILLENSDRL